MATRNYVGARYVPKFADPVEWQANTSYEAMTIVTYNNSSYTSKVPVPPTVGNPAENNQYWVLTGNFNAQVEDYRQTTLQVQEHANEIASDLATETHNRENSDTDLSSKIATKLNNLKNRHFIFVGDGYSCDASAGGIGSTNVYTEFKKLLNIPNLINASHGGSGFVGGYGGQTFLTELQALTLTEDQKNTITDIIVAGGANDANYTTAEIYTAMDAFNDYCETNYPNATIYLSCIGMNLNDFDQTPPKYLNILLTVQQAYQNAMAHNMRYINAFGSISTKADMNNDLIHPNATGVIKIATALANAYLTGNYTNIASTPLKVILNENFTTNEYAVFRRVSNNPIEQLEIGYVTFTYNGELTISHNIPVTLCSFDDIALLRLNPISTTTRIVYSNSTEEFKSAIVYLILDKNKLSITFPESVTAIKNFYITTAIMTSVIGG